MRRTELACVLLAAVIGAAYLAFAPMGADLPAAVFRSDLFARAGFVAVNDAWYGAHHSPAYSLLSPPLGAWLGERLAATIAVVAAAGLFAALLERTCPRTTTWPASLWFAVAAGGTLFTDRIAFLIGLPLGVAALLAIAHDRRWLSIVLAILTPLASPVAGAFLALIGVSWALASRRPFGLALAAAGLAPIAVVNALFPEGGTFPMSAWVFWPTMIGLAAVALAAGPRLNVLRIGAALYAVVVIGCFFMPNAAGANVTRLIALTAGPLLALALWDRRVGRWLLLVAVVPAMYWSISPSLKAMRDARGDQTAKASYFDPLVHELERIEARDGPIRLEIPFTKMHWEAARVADRIALARGWLRQLDRDRNALFYEKPLRAPRYVRWLRDNAISYVALSDAPLDFSAREEAALIRDGLPQLRPVWRNAHWTLYRVDGARPLGVSAMGPDGFTVRAPRAGSVVDTRIRFSPHWAVVEGSGCVSEGPGGFTRVRATAGGSVRVGTRVDVARALLRQTGARCN